MAGIADEMAALEFDLACAARLQFYDADVLKTQAKRIAYEVAKLWSGSTGDDD